MTGGHLINRPAYSEPCSNCRQRIIIAIDSGLTIYADTAPLSVNEEIAAHLTHRGVYDLISAPGAKTWLTHRNIFRIRSGRKYPVLGDHQCPDGSRPHNGWQIPAQRATHFQRPRKPASNPAAPIPF